MSGGVKTPTAAAALLIDHLKAVLDTLNDAQDRLIYSTRQRLSTLDSQLSTLSEAIPRLFSIVRTRQETRLDTYYQRILSHIQQRVVTSQSDIRNYEQRMSTAIDRRLTSENHRLQLMEEKAKSLDPTLLLRRGYSITLKDGKAVRDVQALQKGDEIETRLANGLIHSTVQ